MRKLFLLEDDLSLISGLTFAFKKQGFALDTARTLAEAEVLWSDRKYDLLVLDVSLPDGSGFDFCQKVRCTSNVPILFLTASDEEMNIIMGLELGGDDYLTKPFSVEELLARLRVALRRVRYDTSRAGDQASIYENGELRIDYAAGCVYRGGTEIHLTPIEYKLICVLAKNTGKVLTHNYLLNEVWGSPAASDTPSLRVFMATLRKKIEEDPSHPRYIQTHIGVGYRMIRQ